MFSRRDILKASAIGAAAASMGGMIKAAVADEQHNTVTAGKDRPPINAKVCININSPIAKNGYWKMDGHGKPR